MTISIWILLIIIAVIFILFYYKKNKFKLYKIEKAKKKDSTKYSFFNAERMLENISKKESKDVNENIIKEKKEVEDNNDDSEDNIIKESKKTNNINFKEGIISSIILKNRK